jgi:hypothetical protein
MAFKGQQKTTKLPKGLFEALQDLSSGISLDTQKQFGLKSFDDDKSGQKDQGNQEFEQLFQKQIFQAETVRREELVVFSAKEQETKNKVNALINEVKNLSKAVSKLETQIDTAASIAPVNPGVYHETFFEKLISFIKSMTKNINSASNWLSTSSNKAKKNPYYWQQVKKQGSNFYLSQERYMSTQAG